MADHYQEYELSDELAEAFHRPIRPLPPAPNKAHKTCRYCDEPAVDGEMFCRDCGKEFFLPFVEKNLRASMRYHFPDEGALRMRVEDLRRKLG